MSRKYLDNAGLTYFWNKVNTKKQNTLVSGTNIKTINNETILGNGNIDVDNIVDLSSYSAGDTISNSTIVAKLKKDNIIIIKGDSRYRMVNYSDSMYLYTVMNKVDGGDYIVLSESGNNLFVAIMDSTYWQLKIDNNNKLSADLISDGTTNKTVTSSEKSTWNGKYTKPSGGIPSTDLSSAVQTSLGKADTALQSHQDISGKVDVEVNMTDSYNHDYTGTIENNGNSIKIQSNTDYTITDTYLECADTSISMVSTNGNYVGGISANAFEPQMISQYTHDNTIDYAGIYSKSNGPVIEYYKSGTIKGKLQIDTDGTKLSGVVTPTTNDMAANKSYVDTAVSSKVSSATITNIVTCTTAEYNASSKDSNTIYLLTD